MKKKSPINSDPALIITIFIGVYDIVNNEINISFPVIINSYSVKLVSLISHIRLIKF